MDEGRSAVTSVNFIGLIINSNVFIAIAALVLTISTQIQLNFGPEWHPYLFIIFFATLFEYILLTKRNSVLGIFFGGSIGARGDPDTTYSERKYK